MTQQDWRLRGACREKDPELFFPVGKSGPALAQRDEAKAVCAKCEVRSECLTWALNSGQEFGVWGGADEDELRSMRRRPKGDEPSRGTPVRAITEIDELIILQRFDAGTMPATLERETGIDRETCLVVWRKHRDSLNPPAKNGTTPKELAS